MLEYWWAILLAILLLTIPFWEWLWEGFVWSSRYRVLRALQKDGRQDINMPFRIQDVARDTLRGGPLDLSQRKPLGSKSRDRG